jgi:hypothetical protein
MEAFCPDIANRSWYHHNLSRSRYMATNEYDEVEEMVQRHTLISPKHFLKFDSTKQKLYDITDSGILFRP